MESHLTSGSTEALLFKLHELLACHWEKGKLLQDQRDAVIVTLYRNKGEITWSDTPLTSQAMFTQWTCFKD